MSLREKILGTIRVARLEPVLVPAWNDKVWVKELEADEKDSFEASLAEDRQKALDAGVAYKPRVRARMLLWCVRDERGAPVFLPEDEPSLAKMIAHELEPVINKVEELNKFRDGHRDKFEKKYATAGGGATPADSPGSGESSTPAS